MLAEGKHTHNLEPGISIPKLNKQISHKKAATPLLTQCSGGFLVGSLSTNTKFVSCPEAVSWPLRSTVR